MAWNTDLNIIGTPGTCIGYLCSLKKGYEYPKNEDGILAFFGITTKYVIDLVVTEKDKVEHEKFLEELRKFDCVTVISFPNGPDHYSFTLNYFYTKWLEIKHKKYIEAVKLGEELFKIRGTPRIRVGDWCVFLGNLTNPGSYWHNGEGCRIVQMSDTDHYNRKNFDDSESWVKRWSFGDPKRASSNYHIGAWKTQNFTLLATQEMVDEARKSVENVTSI